MIKKTLTPEEFFSKVCKKEIKAIPKDHWDVLLAEMRKKQGNVIKPN